MGFHVITLPWVLGISPWFTLAPTHPSSAGLTLVSLFGLVFKHPHLHAILVLVSLAMAITTIFLIPVAPT